MSDLSDYKSEKFNLVSDISKLKTVSLEYMAIIFYESILKNWDFVWYKKIKVCSEGIYLLHIYESADYCKYCNSNYCSIKNKFNRDIKSKIC